MTNNLKTARKARGLTQAEVAEAIEASLSTYRNWEQGRSDIPSKRLEPLAKLYGVSADYLMGLTERSRMKELNDTAGLLTDEEIVKVLEFIRFVLLQRDSRE